MDYKKIHNLNFLIMHRLAEWWLCNRPENDWNPHFLLSIALPINVSLVGLHPQPIGSLLNISCYSLDSNLDVIRLHLPIMDDSNSSFILDLKERKMYHFRPFSISLKPLAKATFQKGRLMVVGRESSINAFFRLDSRDVGKRIGCEADRVSWNCD